MFQCHHGVPASYWPAIMREWEKISFNATTAFLLRVRAEAGPDRLRGFQCHHGVPASTFRARRKVRRSEFQCHHGVPASAPSGQNRSKAVQVSMPPRRSCFPVSAAWVTPSTLVSMPPRRSCFIDVEALSAQAQPGFNATTAFLLHPEGARAQRARNQFQCHHGVPASPCPRLGGWA